LKVLQQDLAAGKKDIVGRQERMDKQEQAGIQVLEYRYKPGIEVQKQDYFHTLGRGEMGEIRHQFSKDWKRRSNNIKEE
jgi:hypothetical protein